MKTIELDPSRAKQVFASIKPDVPIVMINLLKFRAQADYSEGSEFTACSGAEAYQRYGELVSPKVESAGGVVVWSGACKGTLIAPEDEDWDQAILVRYPSLSDFLGMASDQAYASMSVHRTAALLDSRLILSEQD